MNVTKSYQSYRERTRLTGAAAYAVVDLDAGRLALRHVEYDTTEVIRAIEETGLPDELAAKFEG